MSGMTRRQFGQCTLDSLLTFTLLETLISGNLLADEVKLVGGNGIYTWTLGTRESERYEHWEMKLDGGSGFGGALVCAGLDRSGNVTELLQA